MRVPIYVKSVKAHMVHNRVVNNSQKRSKMAQKELGKRVKFEKYFPILPFLFSSSFSPNCYRAIAKIASEC